MAGLEPWNLETASRAALDQYVNSVPGTTVAISPQSVASTRRPFLRLACSDCHLTDKLLVCIDLQRSTTVLLSAPFLPLRMGYERWNHPANSLRWR